MKIKQILYLDEIMPWHLIIFEHWEITCKLLVRNLVHILTVLRQEPNQMLIRTLCYSDLCYSVENIGTT